MYQKSPILQEIYITMPDNKPTPEEAEQARKQLYGIGSAGAAFAGEELLRNNWDRLNGTVTRFHNTDTKNVSSIMDQGLKASKANDPNVYTRSILKHINPEELDDLVYTSKDRSFANNVGRQRKRLGYSNNSGKNIKLKFNYDDISKQPKIKNPETLGDIKKWYSKVRFSLTPFGIGLPDKYDDLKGVKKYAVDNLYKGLDSTTHVFKGDISPEHIVGSKHYKKQIDFKRWLDYVKKHPKRFAKGAGYTAAGIGSLGLSGYGAYKALSKNNSEEK